MHMEIGKLQMTTVNKTVSHQNQTQSAPSLFQMLPRRTIEVKMVLEENRFCHVSKTHATKKKAIKTNKRLG